MRAWSWGEPDRQTRDGETDLCAGIHGCLYRVLGSQDMITEERRARSGRGEVIVTRNNMAEHGARANPRKGAVWFGMPWIVIGTYVRFHILLYLATAFSFGGMYVCVCVRVCVCVSVCNSSESLGIWVGVYLPMARLRYCFHPDTA